MKIAVVGTGYVGLVTGVSLSEIGHNVCCIDTDEEKILKMKKGLSPIYEPGLEELMVKNFQVGRLNFSSDYSAIFKHAELIYIAVGTPENEDGTANLTFINQVVDRIAQSIENDVIVVTKSTVPVGTNHYIKRKLQKKIRNGLKIEVVSNPEFLREGSAIKDVFHGDRIVIGSDSKEALKVIRKVNEPFGISIFETSVTNAEMIKYASNGFLATKISYINEIANICEKVGADVEEVAFGMGMDSRIGHQFLKAGIGYGGACFPKDTKALKKIAENVDYEFSLLKEVIEFNNRQQMKLVNQAINNCISFKGKTVGILGLAFKPDTDDIREAASLVIIPELVKMGANIKAYDPAAIENAKKVLPEEVEYVQSALEAIDGTDLVFILTDWEEFKMLPLENFTKRMKTANIYDGRNCFSLKEIQEHQINYYSIGRKSVAEEKVRLNS